MSDMILDYTYRAVARDVHDGDTIYGDLDQGFHQWKHDMGFRFARINAPELSVLVSGHYVPNPPGVAARDFLRTLIAVGDAFLFQSLHDKPDAYSNRWDGEVYFGTWKKDVLTNAVNINDLLVAKGFAVYKTYALHHPEGES